MQQQCSDNAATVQQRNTILDNAASGGIERQLPAAKTLLTLSLSSTGLAAFQNLQPRRPTKPGPPVMGHRGLHNPSSPSVHPFLSLHACLTLFPSRPSPRVSVVAWSLSKLTVQQFVLRASALSLCLSKSLDVGFR